MTSIMKKNTLYKIYFDMDGVLVNFEGGYNKIMNSLGYDSTAAKGGKKHTAEAELVWGNYKFWSNLGWEHGGREIWNTAFNLFQNIFILTSSSTVDQEQSEIIKHGKESWIAKNIPSFDLKNFIIVNGKELKQEYARRYSVLIDDKKETIQQWDFQGGYGIHHNSVFYKKTIEQLEQLSRPIKTIKLSEIIKDIYIK